MDVALEVPQTIIINSGVFKSMINLRDEIDSIIETIEILNDRELIESIKRGERDIKEGKTTHFDSADKAKEWLKNELEI